MSGLTYDICLVYLDDILVFLKTSEEHCNRLSTIFDRLEWYTLKLKPTKCHLFQRKVMFLGHVVSGKGIQCDPDEVAAIAMWPMLTFWRFEPFVDWHPITGPLSKTSRNWQNHCTT